MDRINIERVASTISKRSFPDSMGQRRKARRSVFGKYSFASRKVLSYIPLRKQRGRQPYSCETGGS